jgi:hypothetical protein
VNVLSLFDGMSCGRAALESAGFKVDKYFASEIDKNAMAVSAYNYPDIIQIGDVCKVDVRKIGGVDVLMGGSPCQNFSRANSERKGLLGDKSSLFYQYVKLYKDLKPKYFLLENVIMDKFFEDQVSEIFQLNPIRINSCLVSAQLRDRLYWTNIPVVGMPEDKNINLQSILTDGYTDRVKSRSLLVSDSRPLANQERMFYRYSNTGFTTVVFKSPDFDYRKGIRYLYQEELEKLQTIRPGYTKCLTRNQSAAVLGNGWTVDVIAFILQFMDEEKVKQAKANQKQTTLFDMIGEQ